MYYVKDVPFRDPREALVAAIAAEELNVTVELNGAYVLTLTVAVGRDGIPLLALAL
jgi:hypothetical protein